MLPRKGLRSVLSTWRMLGKCSFACFSGSVLNPQLDQRTLKRKRLCLTFLSSLSVELTAQYVIVMQKVVIVVRVVVIARANLESTYALPGFTYSVTLLIFSTKVGANNK